MLSGPGVTKVSKNDMGTSAVNCMCVNGGDVL